MKEADEKSRDNFPLPLLAENHESIEEISNDVHMRDSVPVSEKTCKKGTRSSLVKLNELQDYVKDGIESGKLVEQYDVSSINISFYCSSL